MWASRGNGHRMNKAYYVLTAAFICVMFYMFCCCCCCSFVFQHLYIDVWIPSQNVKTKKEWMDALTHRDHSVCHVECVLQRWWTWNEFGGKKVICSILIIGQDKNFIRKDSKWLELVIFSAPTVWWICSGWVYIHSLSEGLPQTCGFALWD